MSKPEPMDKDQIEGIAADAMENAVDFIDSEIAPDRIKAQRYFDGEVDIGSEDGRSQVVSTKVRDTVRNIKPSLMRIFMTNARAVEFIPQTPQDVQNAEQATDYVNWAFMEAGGYKLLHDAFHDALVKKNGILKSYWDENEIGKIYTYTNLTDEEYMAIASEPDVEIIEHSEEIAIEAVIGMDGMEVEQETKEHELKIMRTEKEGKLAVKSLPSEEFFVDRNATCISDAYIVAHKTEMRVGDVVAMGFDFDEVYELDADSTGSTGDDMEVYERKGYMEDDEEVGDPSMKLIEITEAYMRIDAEGTGIPMLYKLILGGSDYKLLDYELWDDIPFSVFEVDPEPHAFYGRSIADLLINDQDAATSMVRGILDNVALTNNPRMEVLEDMVSMDDVLNNEIGAIVRSRQIGSVQPLAVPFIAGATMPMLQYMDQLTETKTGVSRASLGLDPDSLQNTSATAAKLAAQGGQGQIEVIARNLAEGMRDLFRLILKLVIKNSPEQQMMRLGGQFIPIDPSVWNSSMDCQANVGLGSGQEDIKLATLNQALQTQMMIYQQYGAQNGLVSLTQIRNTLADIMSLGGYRNAERYFNPMNPQIEQQIIQAMMQQQQGAQEGQADPNAAYLQAEQLKAQVKMQTDMARIQAQQQAEAAKIQANQQSKMAELQFRRETDINKLTQEYQNDARDDDRLRDKMAQDLYIEQARLAGQHGTALDVATIKAMQNAQRNPDGSL